MSLTIKLELKHRYVSSPPAVYSMTSLTSTHQQSNSNSNSNSNAGTSVLHRRFIQWRHSLQHINNRTQTRTQVRLFSTDSLFNDVTHFNTSTIKLELEHRYVSSAQTVYSMTSLTSTHQRSNSNSNTGTSLPHKQFLYTNRWRRYLSKSVREDLDKGTWVWLHCEHLGPSDST